VFLRSVRRSGKLEIAAVKTQRQVFRLTVSCHGEDEYFLLAKSDLLHAREPSSGQEMTSPLYVIAFQCEQTSKRIRVIETIPQNLSIRIWNHTNRLVGE
jgi:hypothetical protein